MYTLGTVIRGRFSPLLPSEWETLALPNQIYDIDLALEQSMNQQQEKQMAEAFYNISVENVKVLGVETGGKAIKLQVTSLLVDPFSWAAILAILPGLITGILPTVIAGILISIFIGTVPTWAWGLLIGGGVSVALILYVVLRGKK